MIKSAIPGSRVLVAEVVGVTEDGELVAKPSDRSSGGPSEIILSPTVPRRRRLGRAGGIGDRVLVRLDPASSSPRTGHILSLLPHRPERFVGIVVSAHDGRLCIEDCAGKPSMTYRIRSVDPIAAGDVVSCSRAGNARDQVRILERVGSLDDPRCIPAMVAARFDILTGFDPDAEKEASACGPLESSGRDDLTGIPFVTVDGEDARDFDDAVAAAGKVEGGYRAFVAIADVAHYVRPGGALDRAARKRGNSVYLPGQVFPMLPEPISNGWCSLMPGVPRGAVVAELDIDASGELTGSTFRRALVRSRARVTYDALEDAVQSGTSLPGIERRHIEALYGAFRLLCSARRKRGALDIRSVEPSVTLDPATGDVSRFATARQLESHRLIEEFMVLANTAVARRLMQCKLPFLYRVHDAPRTSRTRALQDDLRALTGRARVFSGAISSRRLNEVLEGARGRHNEESVHLAVLRAQSQAEYSPDNIGHFGLGLRHYAHFTSPIRRYSDLTVHRVLLHTLGLEPRPALQEDELRILAGDLSSKERRSAAAEREACQRYASRYLQRVSAPSMPGRIVSVERYGAFIRLDESGIEGLLPMAGLGPGYFRFDARARQISRQATGETFGPGDAVTVQLADVDPVRGRVAFRRVN